MSLFAVDTQQLLTVDCFIIAFSGATAAEGVTIHCPLAPVVHAFAALLAHYPRARASRQVLTTQLHTHRSNGEEVLVANHFVSFELLAIRRVKLGKHGLCLETRIIARQDAHRL